MALNSCEACGASVKVVETRKVKHGTRRRRQCEFCKQRFTTLEIRLPENRINETQPGRGFERLYQQLDEVIDDYVTGEDQRREDQERRDAKISKSAA